MHDAFGIRVSCQKSREETIYNSLLEYTLKVYKFIPTEILLRSCMFKSLLLKITFISTKMQKGHEMINSKVRRVMSLVIVARGTSK